MTIIASGSLSVGEAASTTPSFGAVTTFRGRTPARIAVTLPRGVFYEADCGTGARTSFTGGGRVATLVIMKDVPARDADPLVITRDPREAGGGVYSNMCGAPPVRLAAGRYLVYLLPDGAPVAVSLRLPGLRGSVSLAPTRPVAYDVQFPPPVVLAAEGSGPLYMAGSTGRLRSRGLLFNRIWTFAPGPAITETGSCVQRAGTSPVPVTVRYSPIGCAVNGEDGVSGTNDSAVLVPLVRFYVVHTFTLANAGPGSWEIGGYMTGAGVYSGTGSLSFWLSYD